MRRQPYPPFRLTAPTHFAGALQILKTQRFKIRNIGIFLYLISAHIFPLLLLSTLMPGGKRRFPALMSDVKRTFPSLITEEISSDNEETPAPQPGRLLSTEAFPAALESIPADDWGRTWAAGRTIILRRISKRVKQQVDEMRLSVVVRLNRSFVGNTRTEQPSYTSS